MRARSGCEIIDLDDGKKLSLSASVGVAFITPDTVSDETVLAEADRAMYEFKTASARLA